MIEVGEAEFEELVAAALDGIPRELTELIDNCVVLVAAEPPSEHPHILGQYVGVPLTARDSGYNFVAPDRIMVYRGPLARMCASREELVAEVQVTVVHEIAHHFGIDDESLHALGYG